MYFYLFFHQNGSKQDPNHNKTNWTFGLYWYRAFLSQTESPKSLSQMENLVDFVIYGDYSMTSCNMHIMKRNNNLAIYCTALNKTTVQKLRSEYFCWQKAITSHIKPQRVKFQWWSLSASLPTVPPLYFKQSLYNWMIKRHFINCLVFNHCNRYRHNIYLKTRGFRIHFTLGWCASWANLEWSFLLAFCFCLIY